MNAAIRAVVRTAAKSKMEVIGVQKGFHGLIEGDFISLNKNDVSILFSVVELSFIRPDVMNLEHWKARRRERPS